MLSSFARRAAPSLRSAWSRSACAATSQRLASTLIIAEHNNESVSDGTLAALNAANRISGNTVDVLVAGSQCSAVSESIASMQGVSKVLICDDEALKARLPEGVASVGAAVGKAGNYTHIMGTHNTFGKDVLPRIAGILDIPQVSDVLGIEDENTFTRAIYAGNAICKVECTAPSKVVTVRSTAFGTDSTSQTAASIDSVDGSTHIDSDTISKSSHVADEIAKGTGPSLTAASVVVSGGRGLQNGENFSILYELAKAIGDDSAVGASRAAVDAGYVSNDLQVGQTGKVVAPQLYIAVGISGAIQHVAGMKDSKTIVAINKDEEAPIFAIADYGLKADLFEAVPKLTSLVSGSK